MEDARRLVKPDSILVMKHRSYDEARKIRRECKRARDKEAEEDVEMEMEVEDELVE